MASSVVKVPYAPILGKYRPYLEVIFGNKTLLSQNSLALVDTGADSSQIPYSIGKLLNLEPLKQGENPSYASGVGGKISYLNRRCEIYIIDRNNRKIYQFKENILWIYPDIDMQTRLLELEKNYRDIEDLKSQVKPGTKVMSHLESQSQIALNSYLQINNLLEASTIIGREFMENFDFIQFFHRDRVNEHKCFFNYKLASKKITRIIDIPDKK